jgi:glycerol uptake facilitator protein
MSPFIAEIVGTSILIILGDGVVANVILSKTKGFNGGLISITFGWSMAVFVGVYVSATASGAHLNPAVTIALAYAGKFDWALVPQYLAGQMIGAMIGAFLFGLHINNILMKHQTAIQSLECFAQHRQNATICIIFLQNLLALLCSCLQCFP